MTRNDSYFLRVQCVPDPEYRKQLMDAAQVFMDAGFLRQLLDRLYGLNAELANMEREHELDARQMRPQGNRRSYTACLAHFQRLTARIEKVRNEACFAAAQQVFQQTGKRLPPIEDMNKPPSAVAMKVWEDFVSSAKRVQADLEAKAGATPAPTPAPAKPTQPQPAPSPTPAQPKPAPAPDAAAAGVTGLAETEPPRPITGKELKVYVSLLVKARVPEQLREEFKQQARQGKFNLPQLRQRVAELTTSQAA